VTSEPPAGGASRPPARPLADVLTAQSLAGAKVLAGDAGLDRPVERLNVMEVPDILPWVKPHEFLLTTAYPLRGRPDSLPQLIADLDDAGLAGIGVKLGRYLDALPDEVLEVANARGFPVIQLPDDVGFDEILNEVLTAILHEQALALARAERVHQAFLQLVLDGEGLPEIARDLAELLDAPTLVASTDGTVLAVGGCGSEGLAVGDEVTFTAGQLGVAGVLRTATVVPITAGPRHHGLVAVLAPIAGADLHAVETAATVAALTITKQAEVRAVEDKYRSDLMHDLLRWVDDPTDALARAAGFGWDLDRRVICIVLRLDVPQAPVVPDEVRRRPPLASAVQRAVLTRDPGAAVVRFSHEVVILTGAFDGPGGRADAKAFVAGLARDASIAVGASVSAGLSRPVDDVTAIAAGYEQAGRALTIGRELQDRGAIVHFDDLGAHRLLALIDDRDEVARFVQDVLGELDGDDPGAADLRRTLEVLLETGGNVAEAARRLHFHYNTLRYRIEKLTRLVGPFTDDARLRLDVHLALLARSMRPVGGRGRVPRDP
jgi:PucR family transcriptional regulator, purine catabolism regulatory protein